MSSVHINKTWCDFIVNDTYFMEGIIKHSNYPDKCPVTAVSAIYICYPHVITVYRLSGKSVVTEVARDSWLRNRYIATIMQIGSIIAYAKGLSRDSSYLQVSDNGSLIISKLHLS